jgi:hypothetical protein
MSFDDLFTLLVILLGVLSFVVGAWRKPRRPRPAAPPAPQAKAAPARDSAFERRLEEARARVREANAKQAQPSRRLAETRPPAEPEAASAYTSLPGEGDVTRPSLAVSQPLQVQRKGKPKSARLEAALLGVSRQELLRGVLWQQILNPPRAKRPHGRELSQRP